MSDSNLNNNLNKSFDQSIEHNIRSPIKDSGVANDSALAAIELAQEALGIKQIQGTNNKAETSDKLENTLYAFAYLQQNQPSFDGAEKSDKQATTFWKKIDQNPEPDFKDIITFRNFVHNAAMHRLSGDGGLGKRPSQNTQENLSFLANVDPERNKRTVPFDNQNPPVYFTAGMQTVYLAHLSLKDDVEKTKIDGVCFIDLEIAKRAGANLDPDTKTQLNDKVKDALKDIFPTDYDPTKHKQDIANAKGLSLDEVDDLYERYEIAKRNE